MNDNDINVADEEEAVKMNTTDINPAIIIAAVTQDNSLVAKGADKAEMMEGVNYSTITSDESTNSIESVSNVLHGRGSTIKLRGILEPTLDVQPTMRTKNGHTQLLRNHLSSRNAIKSSSSFSSSPSLAVASATGNTNMTMQKSHKTDAPMLNYIFDSHLATNKHHHYDRWVNGFFMGRVLMWMRYWNECSLYLWFCVYIFQYCFIVLPLFRCRQMHSARYVLRIWGLARWPSTCRQQCALCSHFTSDIKRFGKWNNTIELMSFFLLYFSLHRFKFQAFFR